MRKLNQTGILNPLLIPLIIAGIVLVVASAMAVVYYGKFVDQRDGNQPRIEAAVKEAEDAQRKDLEEDFADREKLPTRSYTSPTELGSVQLTFPKTWSSYVDINGNSGIDYYGHPNYVPSKNVNYALRMSVVTKAFADEMRTYESQLKKGDLKASSVQVSGVKGSRLDGFLKKDQEGSLVIFPLRDKTLKVWTENVEFRGDFDKIVLPGLSFVP
ncbi:MAG: hypothetical protein U0520_00350 [Candidatus Saccharimonadales bacterium]